MKLKIEVYDYEGNPVEPGPPPDRPFRLRAELNRGSVGRFYPQWGPLGGSIVVTDESGVIGTFTIVQRVRRRLRKEEQ